MADPPWFNITLNSGPARTGKNCVASPKRKFFVWVFETGGNPKYTCFTQESATPQKLKGGKFCREGGWLKRSGGKNVKWVCG